MSDWHSAAQLIDHTLLKADVVRSQLLELCDQAIHYQFHSVVVNPANLALVVGQLRGTRLTAGTVIGFPLGANLTVTKLAEAEAALRLGAQELDMVLNIGALKSRDRVLVQTELRSLAHVAHQHGATAKVILETGLLTEEEKILACALAVDSGIDFVKTSTGFGPSGATAADVALMRGVVGHKLGVKAAGGIRTAAQLMELVDAGANRIGTSSGVDIVRELGAPPENG